MEQRRVEAITQQLKEAGSFSSNTLFQDRACVDNAAILVRALFQLDACSRHRNQRLGYNCAFPPSEAVYDDRKAHFFA
jgi:hypothetical protein